jgi:hypothetical protein
MSSSTYDLVVVGSGPAGQKGARCGEGSQARRSSRPHRHDGRRLCSYWDNPKQDTA